VDPITLGHEFAGRVVACGDAAVRIGERGQVEHIRVGDLVTANPKIGGSFLGVTHHGTFAEYVVLPAANVYVLPDSVDPRVGAYVEPLAAAVAAKELVFEEQCARVPAVATALIVPPKWRGVVLGSSRFARLVHAVLDADTLSTDLLTEGTPSPDAFDFAIETSGTARELAMLVDALKPGGLLILKSRNPQPVEISIERIVSKSLTVRAKHYGSFEHAIEIVKLGKPAVEHLFGETFPLARYRDAFARAGEDESRKLFLSCAD
jgi:L-iditol 2-dehydrogenase